MSTPRICMGCFAEWDDERETCQYCGRTMEKKEPDRDKNGWQSGKVLEKRYLLGDIYLKKSDFVIWRCYDSALDIKCFLIVSVGGELGTFPELAWGFMAQEDERCPVPLALKEVGKRYVLVFSMLDKYADKTEFIGWIQPREEAFSSVGELKLEGKTKEQILSADTLLDGRYRILGPLGIGGFGITYLGEDVLLQRNVAIKEYFPAEWAERDENYVTVRSSRVLEAYRYGMKTFGKEAKMTAGFIHTAHLPTIYDILEINDTLYMIMDYVPGISIGKEQKERKYQPYSPNEMAEIIEPVLEALEALHSRRIIHSDISPGNILRGSQGEIVLIDLGAAKYDMDRQPILSAAFLKQDYAAPEQYRTAKEGIPSGEGSWTDIYAVGATMYYLLTGHKPLDALTRLSGKTTDLISPRKYKVKLKKDWMKLIHQCMELEPKKRLRSCREVSEKIRNILQKE